MFGLRNQRGSCWINAALQGVFRIPDLQNRVKNQEEDDRNPVEMTVCEIYATKGEEGLRSFYECVKTDSRMPAGEDIGDSHELLEFLCDKVPFIDKLMRFNVAHVVRCKNAQCSYTDTQNDSVVEFDLAPTRPKMTVSQAIVETVTPFEVADWTCEKCKHKGCTKQLLVGSFPKVLVFHNTSLQTSVSYSAQLVVNSHTYALFAVVCFNGGHWYTFGRDLPPGQPWYELNDTHVRSYDPSHFPLVDTMRLLMYYRVSE
jgi:ubiquitin C-terminal hydrolase